MKQKNWLSFIAAMCLLSGCQDKGDKDVITFGTCGDYPPFEFVKNNELRGFDIELANLIAKEMNKKIKFENMTFNSILVAIQNGLIDAGISTITMTEERKKSFDFSDSYYEESISVLYSNHSPIKDQQSLEGKKIACQLGTTMEIWMKKNITNVEMILVDNNNQGVESLKAGHVEGLLIDGVQAIAFAEQNKNLGHAFIAKSENGYGIALKKDSALTQEINNAIKKLRKKGELEKLQKKWLENPQWNQ